MGDRPKDPALDDLVTALSARVAEPNAARGRAAIRMGRRLQRTAAVKRVAGPATGVVAVAGVVILLGNAFGLFGRSTPGASTGCTTGPSVRFGHDGAVAYVKDDSLHVLDVQSRSDRVLVAHGVGLPVRWSWDGQWIAFQETGSKVGVVPAGGGPVCEPLGSHVQAWAWSPVRAYLVGVTDQGGLVRGGPFQKPRSLLPDGWGVEGDPQFDPTGKKVSIIRTNGVSGPGEQWGIRSIDVRTARQTEITLFPGQNIGWLAGWTPDGSWILYWEGAPMGPLSATPLEAVPSSGGQPVEVVHDGRADQAVAWCGGQLVAASGGDARFTSQKLVIASEPHWAPEPLSLKVPSSDEEIWPSCSTPLGKLVVASVGPNQGNGNALNARWALWLLQPRGSIGGPTTDPGPSFCDEAPRWSRDGSAILFVRRAVGTRHGQLYLLTPRSSGVGPGMLTGPLADLGSYRYLRWSEGIDWYQPRGTR